MTWCDGKLRLVDLNAGFGRFRPSPKKRDEASE
jgi:hypothetical protein